MLDIHGMIKQMTRAEKLAQLSCHMPLEYIKNETVDLAAVKQDFPDGIGRMTQVATGFFSGSSAIRKALYDLQRYAVEQTRMKIPILFQLEALTGVNACGATVYPTPLSIASTFDEHWNYEIGKTVAKQMQHLGVHVALAPVADVCRNAHFGRCAETYGEDAYLCTQFGKQYVLGLQAEGNTKACAKHFLGYAASENALNAAHIPLGKKELIEVYGKPFHAMIQDADLRHIMVTYSAVDGLPVTVNQNIVKKLLKQDMEFQGLAICDATSIELSHTQQGIGSSLEDVAIKALQNEIDADTPITKSYKTLDKAIQEGRCDEALLDAAVYRVLKVKEEMGLFENPYAQLDMYDEAEKQKAETLSLDVARDAVILLKNKDHLLPLAKDKKIALIGPHGHKVIYLMGGYSYPSTLDLLLTAARGETGSMQGFMEILQSVIDKEELKKTLAFDEAKTNLEILEDYVKREYHVHTLAEELREKFSQVVFTDGCTVLEEDEDEIRKAVELAKDCDVIVLAIGGINGFGTQATSGENKARCELMLPKAQRKLMTALKQLQLPMVAVLINGRPLNLTSIIDDVDALVELWVNGSHGAQALAEVLCGEVNPSGRLPVTLPRHDAQTPLYYGTYAGSGYRALPSAKAAEYTDIGNTPLFPFGFGLSYSEFQYDTMKVRQQGETIEVEVCVHNISAMDGKEVIQLYMQLHGASVLRPLRSLVAYKKVAIPAKASITVQFLIHERQLGYFNFKDVFVVEAVPATIMLCRDADTLLQKEMIMLQGQKACYQRQVFTASCKIIG